MTTRTGQDTSVFPKGAVPKRDSSLMQRLVLAAPPLAPDMPPRRHLQRLSIVTALAVIALAAVAYMSGASSFLVVALALVGMACLSTIALALRAEGRARSFLNESTARNRAEVETLADRMWELQESEERFRGLIDALGDVVVHRDREGRIVYANKVFAKLVGVDQRDLVGRSLVELGVDVALAPDDAFAEEEYLSSTDVAIRTADGVRWFSWFELSTRDGVSAQVSHRAIARDITSRKQTEVALISARERAEFASQAKSRFLATVSHEIRTPMNGIMGMAKLLADTELVPEQRTYVGAVSTSAAALLALIEDLLDYSKIEAGRLHSEPQPMSPREIAENVTELLASRAFAKNIGIGCHVAPDVPHMVTSEPGRIRQILLNLLANAVKFTDQGGVLMTVTTSTLKRGRMLRFAVSDTGPGLSPDDTDRIFEEFEQADSSSTRAHGGAGLGLAISRRLVTSMGGSISVTSQLGEGSQFMFEIPVVDCGESPQRPREDALAGSKVVILSGNHAEAEAIAMTLRAHGGEVTICSTATQAAARALGCTSILIDAALETADGKMLKRLRESGFGEAEAVTLIAPTDRGMLGQFRDSGYSTFLARPVRGETLLKMLLSSPSALSEAGVSTSSGGEAPASWRRNDKHMAVLSILVAEDNDVNAMLAKATLLKAGHRVDVVRDGKAAVEATTGQKTRYDLVLMDLHMPVMDGLEAIAAIRRHEEAAGARALPILVLSADSQEETRHSVLAHGASGFATKPLDPDVLLRTIEEHLAA